MCVNIKSVEVNAILNYQQDHIIDVVSIAIRDFEGNDTKRISA